MKAFVLGAGLGTRLQPLTEWLPKPMVPVFHRPLISYAFDHLLSLPAIDGFVVNTHHCPDAYEAAFPSHAYRDVEIAFRHEPVLLETAGGIANVADLLGDTPFIVYNGDILADLPLEPLLAMHQSAANEVTLLLRTDGPGLHIGMDRATGRVSDIRQMLGRVVDAYFQFTGIYVVEQAFLPRLTAGKKESVIPIFLDMIREGARIGGCIEDRGHWWDLGNVATYLRVHRDLPDSGFPIYQSGSTWKSRAGTAQVAASADLGEGVVVGPMAQVAAGAKVRDAVLWPGAVVAQGEHLSEVVVRGPREVHWAHFFG